MRAAVAGGGIAGLVAARQLGLAGWEVDLLEQSPGPRPDGYMMDFFGPGVEASERIGLYPRLAAVSYHVTAAEYVDENEGMTARIDYDRFARLAGGNVLSLLRPDMERAALEALDDVPGGRVRLHYSSRVTDVSQDGGGALVSINGAGVTLPPVDVVIGADGIHSTVRAGVFGPEREYLRPLGMRAAAFIVREPELNGRLRDRFVLTDTIGRTAAAYGLRDDEVATFLVYREPVDGAAPESARDRLRSEFTGLNRTVDRLLEVCPPDPYDDVVAQVVMPRWRSGRAVLVGDACGAVSLLAGQGGSLAIAGAVQLTDDLGSLTDPTGVPQALDRFEQRWRPLVEAAQASGRRAAATFLPASRTRLLLRRWVLRATRLPGVDRLVARMILNSIAK